VKRLLIYSIGIFFLAGLTGCVEDSVYEAKVTELAALQVKYDDVYKKYVSQNPSAMQSQGRRIATQDNNKYNDATVEIALACTRLWFDICPDVWTDINIEAFQNAGYGGHPGMRTVLILFFGILEKAATYVLFLIFIWRVKKLLDAPDAKEVKEAKVIISMAKKAHEELDQRMNNADTEERTRKYNSLAEAEVIERKTAQAKQIHAYVAGIAKNALIIQSALLQQSQPNLVTMEDLNLIKSAYMTKAEAVYKIHASLGHLPYSRIKRMILKGIMKGYTFD